MPVLSVQDIVEAGVDGVYAAATAAGDTVKNDGNLLLHMKNGGAGASTITVTAQKPSTTLAGFGSVTKADVVLAVPAGQDRFLGPFPVTAFNDSSGNLALSWDVDLSVTIATLRLPPVA